MFGDRILETTQTVGTGPISLGGAQDGYRAYSDRFADGDWVSYTITDNPQNPEVWEYGISRFVAGSPQQLSRDVVLDSSQGGARISLQAGNTYTVTCAPLAAPIVGKASSKTANHTVQITDWGATVLMDAGSGERTVSVPSASGRNGFRLGVVKTDATAGTVTISPPGGETIGGFPAIVLRHQHAAVTILSDGGDWQLVARGDALAMGVRHLPIPAAAFVARETDGAGSTTLELSTNDVMVAGFDFDPATEQAVQVMVPMPGSWDGGPFTAKIHWTSEAAPDGSDDVVWGVRALALADDAPIDQAFGAEVTVTDTHQGVTALDVSADTAAITAAGSPAGGRLLALQVARKAADADDTLGADAKLIAVVLTLTLAAANDA